MLSFLFLHFFFFSFNEKCILKKHYPLPPPSLATDRLYFVAFHSTDFKPLETPNTHYFCVDKEFVYENFFNDFGPLTIGMLCRYCQKLQRKLNSTLHKKKKIVHYTTMDEEKRLNAALLFGAYAVSTANFFYIERTRTLIIINILTDFFYIEKRNLKKKSNL